MGDRLALDAGSAGEVAGPRRPLGGLRPGGHWSLYSSCKIEVGTGQQAVLIRKVGLDLDGSMELAPPRKGAAIITRACRPRGPTAGS